MVISRGTKLTVLFIILMLSVLFTSSLALGAPHVLPGDTNENGLVREAQQEDSAEVSQEDNLEEDIFYLDKEAVGQEDQLPLEPIIIPSEPFMGAPAVISAETEPQLPQTGTGIGYSGAGCLLSIIGIIVNVKSC